MPKKVIKENSPYWLPNFRGHNQLKVFSSSGVDPVAAWLLKEFQMCWGTGGGGGWGDCDASTEQEKKLGFGSF